MALSFSAQIKKFAVSVPDAVEATYKASLQDLDEGVKKKTPVDTGFLRNSWMSSHVSMPALTKSADGTGGAPFDSGGNIASAKLGEPFYFGYTANYAGYVEYGARGREGRRMVGLTVQQWPQIVGANAAKAKAAFGL